MRDDGPGINRFLRTRVAVFASVLCVGLGLWLGVARHGSVAAAWQMLRASSRQPLLLIPGRWRMQPRRHGRARIRMW